MLGDLELQRHVGVLPEPMMLLATLTLTSNSSPGRRRSDVGRQHEVAAHERPLLNTPTESAATATAITRSLPLK